MRGQVDWKAVAAGAVVTIAVGVLVSVAAAAVGIGQDSNAIFAFYLVDLVGAVVGGFVAGRRRMDTPMLHGAVAAFCAFVVIAIVGSAINDAAGTSRTLPSPDRAHLRERRLHAAHQLRTCGRVDRQHSAATSTAVVSLLVVDVGTSGCAPPIVRPDATVEHVHHREVLPTTPAPGFVEFDAAAMATATLEVAEAALAEGGPVEAVGIANQRASTIVWDRATGEPVGPGVGWQDLGPSMCLGLQQQGIRVAPNASATKLAFLLDMADPDRTATCASAPSTRGWRGPCRRARCTSPTRPTPL